MMETMHPISGFTSETSLSGHNGPATPPYTPARHKRRLERSDSPASSIHPAETSSPAKKVIKRTVPDTITVSELTESDLGYLTDLDVVYPDELEELSSLSDVDHYNVSTDEVDSDVDSDIGLTSRLSRLDCSDDHETKDEVEMEKARRERRLSRRHGSRVFKRSHSQSLKSGTAVPEAFSDVDLDAIDDQDFAGGVRRLRRRTKGPGGVKEVFEDVGSSAEQESLAESGEDRRKVVERNRRAEQPDIRVRLEARQGEAMVVE